ncbi:hypothetical protein [Viridibacillus arvi]|nr:hypothetical protein [Viridibacillus sp. JNUCC-6]
MWKNLFNSHSIAELFTLLVIGWNAGYLFSFYIDKKRKAKT